MGVLPRPWYVPPMTQHPLSLSSVEKAWVLCAICTILNFHLSVDASRWSNLTKEGGGGGVGPGLAKEWDPVNPRASTSVEGWRIGDS